MWRLLADLVLIIVTLLQRSPARTLRVTRFLLHIESLWRPTVRVDTLSIWSRPPPPPVYENVCKLFNLELDIISLTSLFSIHNNSLATHEAEVYLFLLFVLLLLLLLFVVFWGVGGRFICLDCTRDRARLYFLFPPIPIVTCLVR